MLKDMLNKQSLICQKKKNSDKKKSIKSEKNLLRSMMRNFKWKWKNGNLKYRHLNQLKKIYYPKIEFC